MKTEEQLEAERIEPAAIALRLDNAERMLVQALELIDKHQSTITDLRLELAKYDPRNALLTSALGVGR